MADQYRALYEAKKTTLDAALSLINSGDEIAVACCGNEPAAFLSKLHTLKDKVRDVTVWASITMGSYPFLSDPSFQEAFDIKSWFFMGPVREAYRLGIASYQPVNLHDLPERRFSIRKPNVFVGAVTPMDEHGYVRTSLSLIYEKEAIENADLVIAEVNPNLPLVGGDTEIHISQIDHIVETDRPVPVLPDAVPTATEMAIGEYVAGLVKDGDTIQLGIGGIPNAVAIAFRNKRDLGVHTEMITSSIVDLVACGAITGRKKTLHKGKIIGAFALGNQKLYNFMHNNPAVAIYPANYVNDPFVIRQNDNMISINTAIEVDLTGQVCSESIGTMQFSGTGGQTDTAAGAIHAAGGRSVIALNSTAKNGTISTIQPFLKQGAIVTLSRNNVDYIVTEYGVAQMKGMTVRERVDNLIAVVHPDFRAELRRQAEKYKIR